MTLESEVKLQLAQPLDPHRVTVGQNGPLQGIKYLEGEDVIRTANRIFGYGEWGFELIGQPWAVEKGEQGTRNTLYEVWAAHGRLSVSGGGSFADVGTCVRSGAGSGGLEMAIKGAVTDCVKRCLRNYGDQFGLILYDKTTDMAGLAADFKAVAPTPDVPEWVEPFNKERKAKGITATEIATVIGASGTISNIEKWMTEGNFTTTDLLQFASDLKGFA